MNQSAYATGLRWLKFCAVGGLGIGVQLVVLLILKGWLRIPYLWPTACAVEAAVVHNFIWHERVTWADRPSDRGLRRFLWFNLTTGAMSVAGNLLLMEVFVEVAQLNYLVANAIAIVACSLVNFLVSDRIVFAK